MNQAWPGQVLKPHFQPPRPPPSIRYDISLRSKEFLYGVKESLCVVRNPLCDCTEAGPRRVFYFDLVVNFWFCCFEIKTYNTHSSRMDFNFVLQNIIVFLGFSWGGFGPPVLRLYV